MMKCPTDLQPLIDGDIIRYEVGFAAETGWKTVKEDPEAIPPFDYVAEMLSERLRIIGAECQTDKSPLIFMTEGKTFRYDLAKRKPYKGTRLEKKPWHFDNLTVYLRDVLGAQVVTGIEADDALTIEHLSSEGRTILCSRDKDLRQVPGWFYSWELGHQPSFGPVEITKTGSLTLTEKEKVKADGKKVVDKKLTGTGLAFFYAQVLMGDPTDNIPGLPGCGPVQTYDVVSVQGTDHDPCRAMLERVAAAYQDHYGNDWEEELLEQGRLCWMTRRLHPDGNPVLWEIGMTE